MPWIFFVHLGEGGETGEEKGRDEGGRQERTGEKEEEKKSGFLWRGPAVLFCMPQILILNIFYIFYHVSKVPNIN